MKRYPSEKLDVRYLGPDLDEGCLPAALYFALSAEDSLTLPPFNTPITPFLTERMRVFSISLPFHTPPHEKETALEQWKKSFAEGTDPLSPFFTAVTTLLSELLDEKIIDRSRFGGIGLSRGGFILLHVAAKVPELQTLLLFAPLIHLGKAADFSSLPDEVTNHLSLSLLTDPLSEKTVRTYIGNNDSRVSTKASFDFLQTLVRLASEKRIRSLPFEMIISPSIGYQGHGTSDTVFTQGGQWLIQMLLRL